MLDFVEGVIGALEAGRAVVLATVVGLEGAQPEVIGRKLLVTEEGVLGSLGLLSLDRWVEDEARDAMRGAPRPRVVSRALTNGESRQIGIDARTELRVFLDLMLPSSTLLIVGAGHIAQPLSRMGKMLGFRVVVMDDRASFANRERFPEADQILCGHYTHELNLFPINLSTFVVIVTRGHVQDEAALGTVVGSPAAYIGMIGSPRRVGGVMNRLEQAGVPRGQLERVCAPIGLEIGAETPAEIAVAIMAEVVNVRRRGERHPSALSLAARRQW